MTLVWNSQDVTDAIGSQFGQENSAKFMEWPKARYGLYQVDTVLLDGEQVGVSHDCGYIYNEKSFVSLASIDTEPGADRLRGHRALGRVTELDQARSRAARAGGAARDVAPTPYVSFARSATAPRRRSELQPIAGRSAAHGRAASI